MEDSHEKINFRLIKLEDAIITFASLKESVIRIEERIMSKNSEYFNCPIHNLRITESEKRLNKIEEMVQQLNQFKWQAVGVICVVMLFIQLFASPIADKIFKIPSSNAAQITMVHTNNPYSFQIK